MEAESEDSVEAHISRRGVIKFLCDKSLGAVESCREMLKAMDIVDLYLEDRNTDLEIH